MKPELFDDEELWDLGEQTGLPVLQMFVGLWCFSDREGRFEWRPRALKKHILPYWNGDLVTVLEALASKMFIVRYTVNGRDYGYVRSLKEHQSFNAKEPPSTLPPPEQHGKLTGDSPVNHPSTTGDESPPTRHVWKGTEGNGNGTEEGTEPRERVVLPGPDQFTEPATYTRIPGWWKPSDELYAEALSAGVDRKTLDEDIAYWRARKLGGEFHDIDGFFRAHFARLAKRRETESFKQSKHGSAQPNAGKTGWE